MSTDGKKRCTETLINSLCGELDCVKVMKHPIHRVLPWAALALAYVIMSVLIFGFRYDFNTKILDSSYVFEIILVFFMSMSSAFCAIWLCIPDMRGQKWMIAVPFTLLLSFSALIGIESLLRTFDIPEIKLHICYIEAGVFGVIPAIAIFFLSVTGKTTHPYLLAFMNALAVGGLGYIGLRLTCSNDDMGHAFFYHILPYLVFGVIVALAGRKIYKW